jgi:hypothetical protein
MAALSICGLQLHCRPCEREWNLAHAAELLRARPGHQLYLLPECSTCGSGAPWLGARGKSDCHFYRETATEYYGKLGIKWLSCPAKWQSDL